MINIFNIALESFKENSVYDFEDAKLSERLAALTEEAYEFKEFWQTPPTNVIYLHRKLGGMFLLATRLGAQVNVHQMVKKHIKTLN